MAKAKNSLGRPAVGLSRYYMDVGWYRHPRFTGLPIEALFLFDAGIGYCIGHGTNGEMPGDLEELSIALGVRLSAVRKGAKALLDAGRWQRHGQSIVSAGFGAHNPTKEEIEDWQEERSKSGTRGNHVRWHEARGIVDPECQYCPSSPEDTDAGSLSDRCSDSPSDPNGVAEAIPNGSHGMEWDGMTTTSRRQSEPPATGPPDDDPRIQPALDAIVDDLEAEVTAAGKPPTSPSAWRRAVRADVARRYGPTIAEIAQWPAQIGADPRDLADIARRSCEKPGYPKPPVGHDPACPACAGCGWLFDADGNALARCDCEAPTPQPAPELEPFGASA